MDNVTSQIQQAFYKKQTTEYNVEVAEKELNRIQENISAQSELEKKNLNDFKEITSAAKEKYFEELEKDYQKKNEEYERQCFVLNSQLEDIRNSIKAKVEAAKREE